MYEQMTSFEREVLRDSILYWIENNASLKEQETLKEEFILQIQDNMMKYSELRRQVLEFFWKNKFD